jgi:WD40 repeat protein
LSCSLSGNHIVIGYTDDKLKVYDMRSRGEEFDFNLEGGHTNIPKAVKLTSDGMICYSVGSDQSMRVWDIG